MVNERWHSLRAVAWEVQVCRAVRHFNDSHIEPILIKGWAVARFYGENANRVYTDIDLVISPDQFDDANRVWREWKRPGAPIDLHCSLRNLDRIPWDTAFKRSQIVDLNGTPIRVLADEDNIRVTAAHWLMDGGVNREKLLDIYYLVKNRRNDLDWPMVLEAGTPERRGWVIAAIATARDYAQLDVSGLPEEIRTFQLPEWYKKTLEREWRLGPYPRLYLYLAIKNPKTLFAQLRRRFPPNPIAAVVDAEGRMDARSPLNYQFRSFFKKIPPFLKGTGRMLKYRLSK